MFLCHTKQHNLFEFYIFSNIPRNKPRTPCLLGLGSRTALGFFLGTAAGTVMVHFSRAAPAEPKPRRSPTLSPWLSISLSGLLFPGDIPR